MELLFSEPEPVIFLCLISQGQIGSEIWVVELQMVNFKHFAGGKGSENLKVFNLESDLWKLGPSSIEHFQVDCF